MQGAITHPQELVRSAQYLVRFRFGSFRSYLTEVTETEVHFLNRVTLSAKSMGTAWTAEKVNNGN